MNEELQKLFDIAKNNVAQNPSIVGVDTGEITRKYLKGLGDEVAEVEEELKPENVIHLQDELSDIIWNNAVLLELCEERGWIDSVEAVYTHALDKYQQRAPAFIQADQALWDEVKTRQKKELADQNAKRYQY